MPNPVKKILSAVQKSAKSVHKTAKRVLGLKARKTRKHRKGGYKYY